MGKEKPQRNRKPVAGGDKRNASDKPAYKGKSGARPADKDRNTKKDRGGSPDKFFGKPKRTERKWEKEEEKTFNKRDKPRREQEEPETKAPVTKQLVREDEVMPLNKFVAHCGICSRRDAAELVKEGKVKVNGEVMLQPGYKIQAGDKVEYNGKIITSQKNLKYVLLNKPKNYLTTTEDPQERKTVMELVADAGTERIYPVGRLDRNTSGLLLLTNDGELAQKLSHPKYNIKKVYQVVLDKVLSKPHFDKIVEGFDLEDGRVDVDAIAYLDKKNEIGVEIHSGRNRIVRRIFEHFGYSVEKLDRVVYAGLTKKNIPRGKWRFLNEKEVINLKHFKPQ